jgi:hypothetical protein
MKYCGVPSLAVSVIHDACPARFTELQSFKAEQRVQMNYPLKLHSEHAYLSDHNSMAISRCHLVPYVNTCGGGGGAVLNIKKVLKQIYLAYCSEGRLTCFSNGPQRETLQPQRNSWHFRRKRIPSSECVGPSWQPNAPFISQFLVSNNTDMKPWK